MPVQQQRYSDPAGAAQACAMHVLKLLGAALAPGGDASLAISGGSTPKLMFDYMARQSFDWQRVHLFWVDERCVPPDHEQSNYRLAEESFVVPAGIPRRNVHRIAGELPPQEAADRYSEELRDYFRVAAGEMPRFDVIHRGIGADCHTASLFPGEPLIRDRENLAAPVYVEKLKSWRITLLPGVLLNAKHTVMLVCGADKAEPVRHIFHAPYDAMQCPAQLTHCDGGDVAWFLDVAAASLMK